MAVAPVNHFWCGQPVGLCRCTVDSVLTQFHEAVKQHDLGAQTSLKDVKRVIQGLPVLTEKEQLPAPPTVIRRRSRVLVKVPTVATADYVPWSLFPMTLVTHGSTITTSRLPSDLLGGVNQGDSLPSTATIHVRLRPEGGAGGALRFLSAHRATSSAVLLSTEQIGFPPWPAGLCALWTFIPSAEFALAVEVLADML